MALMEQIKAVYPDLDKEFRDGTIILQNDSDGNGDYIAEWNYDMPIPDVLILGIVSNV